MPHYICRNPDCPEADVPKDAPQIYDGDVQCGECGEDCEGVE